MWHELLNQRSKRAGHRFVWRRLVGICCILLVVLGASAELNHAHASGRINPDCSLCVTAHSTAQATVHAMAPLVLRPVSDCAESEPLFFGYKQAIRLSIRPPPVAPALS
jgi:disulfide bond formation protein DsbB